MNHSYGIIKRTKAAGCSYEKLLNSVERLGNKTAKVADEEAANIKAIKADEPVTFCNRSVRSSLS